MILNFGGQLRVCIWFCLSHIFLYFVFFCARLLHNMIREMKKPHFYHCESVGSVYIRWLLSGRSWAAVGRHELSFKRKHSWISSIEEKPLSKINVFHHKEWLFQPGLKPVVQRRQRDANSDTFSLTWHVTESHELWLHTNRPEVPPQNTM